MIPQRRFWPHHIDILAIQIKNILPTWSKWKRRILYSLSVFTVIVSYDFVTQQLFSSTISIIFYFIFSSINWGRIQEIEFEQHGLLLPVHCMGKLFKVSTNYFVLFVLERVTFYFCLFLKLSLATTISVDTCLCLLFDII